MNRPRVSIAGFLAAVALVAVNVAVMRSIYVGSHSEAAFFYAFGVLPFASLLIAVALISAPSFLRGARLSPFVFGFEAVGWVVVFAFISWYSIASQTVIGYAETIAASIRPTFVSYLENAPDWAKFSVELGFAIVLFSLPQLLMALLGGRLAAKFGFSARFERQDIQPSAPASETFGETTGVGTAPRNTQSGTANVR